jgi:hypothetical protein
MHLRPRWPIPVELQSQSGESDWVVYPDEVLSIPT